MTTFDYIAQGVQQSWNNAVTDFKTWSAEQQQNIAHMEAGAAECQHTQLMQSMERTMRGY